jgi:hypothetical protein
VRSWLPLTPAGSAAFCMVQAHFEQTKMLTDSTFR